MTCLQDTPKTYIQHQALSFKQRSLGAALDRAGLDCSVNQIVRHKTCSPLSASGNLKQAGLHYGSAGAYWMQRVDLVLMSLKLSDLFVLRGSSMIPPLFSKSFTNVNILGPFHRFTLSSCSLYVWNLDGVQCDLLKHSSVYKAEMFTAVVCFSFRLLHAVYFCP